MRELKPIPAWTGKNCIKGIMLGMPISALLWGLLALAAWLASAVG
jgi:hypothetical protein